MALGNEPVRIDGQIRGRVTSGGYGYRRTALDRLRVSAGRDVSIGTDVEVDIFGRWVAGEVTREPLLDPAGERVRAPIATSGADRERIARRSPDDNAGPVRVGSRTVTWGFLWIMLALKLPARGADLHRLVGDQAGAGRVDVVR